ncbi:MAG: 4Fe-4S dicluster domain-containing protein [Planctomycetota bacterium]
MARRLQQSLCGEGTHRPRAGNTSWRVRVEQSAMALDRREFLRSVATVGAAAAGLGEASQSAEGSTARTNPNFLGVLMDIPNCIGCRKCEFACQQVAGFEVPPIETFDDKSVFDTHRRPHPRSYTTVNRFPNPIDPQRPIYVKANCLHCNDPACASACLVGAFKKEPNGAVTYDAWKCMGCRYCMVACPFQIPTYEYDNALTPEVRKCMFCFDKIMSEGGAPACVRICPNDALVFGKRDELVAIAHERIRSRPDTYVDHVYGEHEAGGTSWLYLSSVPFEQIGFVRLGSLAPPRLTETVQQGIFKMFMPPLALYGLLGLVMWLTKKDEERPTSPPAVPADSAATSDNGRARAMDYRRTHAPPRTTHPTREDEVSEVRP